MNVTLTNDYILTHGCTVIHVIKTYYELMYCLLNDFMYSYHRETRKITFHQLKNEGNINMYLLEGN